MLVLCLCLLVLGLLWPDALSLLVLAALALVVAAVFIGVLLLIPTTVLGCLVFGFAFLIIWNSL